MPSEVKEDNFEPRNTTTELKVLFQSEKGVGQRDNLVFPEKYFIGALSAEVLIFCVKNGYQTHFDHQKTATKLDKCKK